MIIIESARKHGISDQDIIFVYESSINSIIQEGKGRPNMTMLFGHDTIGRGLEVGYITNDHGEDIIIHAMKIRPNYKHYLYNFRGE